MQQDHVEVVLDTVDGLHQYSMPADVLGAEALVDEERPQSSTGALAEDFAEGDAESLVDTGGFAAGALIVAPLHSHSPAEHHPAKRRLTC